MTTPLVPSLDNPFFQREKLRPSPDNPFAPAPVTPGARMVAGTVFSDRALMDAARAAGVRPLTPEPAPVDPRLNRALAGTPRASERVSARLDEVGNPLLSAVGRLLEADENVARGLIPGAVENITYPVSVAERTGRLLKGAVEARSLDPHRLGAIAANEPEGELGKAFRGETLGREAQEFVDRQFQPEGAAGLAGRIIGGVAVPGAQVAARRGAVRVEREAAERAAQAERGAAAPPPRTEAAPDFQTVEEVAPVPREPVEAPPPKQYDRAPVEPVGEPPVTRPAASAPPEPSPDNPFAPGRQNVTSGRTFDDFQRQIDELEDALGGQSGPERTATLSRLERLYDARDAAPPTPAPVDDVLPDQPATPRPAIDQGILSPSGRVSGRAQRAAQERNRVELFGPEGLQRPSVPQPDEAATLRRQAKELRDLAERGMKPRAHATRAGELEARAAALESTAAAGRKALELDARAIAREAGIPETSPPSGATPAAAPEAPAASFTGPAPEAAVTARPPVRSVPGGRADIKLPEGQSVPAHYALVDADQLVPSHDPFSFSARPDYPEGVQNRRYHADRVAQEDVARVAQQLDPEVLLDRTTRATEGPPIITPGGIVLSGNTRTMALLRARGQRGGVAGERFRRYEEAIRNRAADFGLSAEPGSNQMLVRVVDDPALDLSNRAGLRELAAAFNDVATKAKDPLADAAVRAVRLREADRALDQFARQFDPDMTMREWLGTGSGREFVSELVNDGVIPRAEIARFTDPLGTLSPEGRSMVERMMYVAAVGDAEVVGRAPAQILQRLEHAIPSIVQVSRLEGWDLGPVLREALALHTEVRANARINSIDELLSQGALFGRSDTREGVRLAQFLESGRKHQVAEAFRTYARRAREATGQAESVDMFGHEPAEAPEVFRQTFAEATEGRGGAGLFGEAGKLGTGRFYSRLERAIERVKFNRAPAETWISKLRGKQSSADEFDRSVGAALRANPRKQWTKTEVLALARGEGYSALDEAQLGPEGGFHLTKEQRAVEIRGIEARRGLVRELEAAGVAQGERETLLTSAIYDPDLFPDMIPGTAADTPAIRALAADIAAGQAATREAYRQPARFAKYTLPGGENYREIVIQHPAAAGFRGAHFGDTEDALIHIRLKDRTVNGQRTVFVEEIQSDLHQAGRKKGYGPVKVERNTGRFADTRPWTVEGTLFADRSNAEDFARKISGGRVPDAPFQNTPDWAGLAMKRVIDEAVSEGAERVAWTTGAQQAARYDLAKQVDQLFYRANPDGTYRVSVQTAREGRPLGERLTPERIADLVGKDVAERITSGAGKAVNLAPNNQPADPWNQLEAGELTVGGEGMRAFYDKMLPDWVRAYGKRYGLEIEMVPGPAMQGKVPSFRITPELRNAVLREGQPLGRIGDEGAGAVPIMGALSGGVAGGAAGYASADEDATTGQRIVRAAGGALVGAAAGASLGRGAERFGAARRARVARAYDEAASLIDFGGRSSRRAGREGGSILQRVQRFGDRIANGLGPIERLGQQAFERGLRPTLNPKFLLSYVKGSRSTVEAAVEQGVLDPLTREVVGPSYQSLFEPFAKNPAKIREALTYLVGERVIARGARAVRKLQPAKELEAAAAAAGKAPKPPTAAQVRAARANAVGGNERQYAAFERAVRAGRADPMIQSFRAQYEAYTEALGQYAVKSGVWTPEMWAKFKASDALYIPMQRVMGTAETSRFGGSGGLVNVTAGVKKFTGSQRLVMDPSLALAEYTDAIIRRADRYRVGASLFDAAEQLGDAGKMLLTPITAEDLAQSAAVLPQRAAAIDRLTKAAAARGIDLPPEILNSVDDLFVPALDPHNPVIWRWAKGPKGMREYASVQAPDLVHAVYAMNPGTTGQLAAVKRFLDLTLLPVKRMFTVATTALVPRFAGGTNPARDIPDALMKSTSGLTPVDIAAGLRESILDIVGQSEVAAQMRRSGLGNVSMFGGNAGPRTFQRRFAPTTMGQMIRGRLGHRLMSPLAGAEKIGDASDLFPRLGEARAAVRKYAGKVTSGEWSPADLRLYASTQGRGVTLDFANKPGHPVVQFVADYIPFMRPALQGPVRFTRALRENPKKSAAVISGMVGLTVFSWAMKHRSDRALARVNDRRPEERAGFLLFPMDDDAKVTLRLPLGQEMGIVTSGVTAALDAWYDDDPNAAGLFIQSIGRALPPGIPEVSEGYIPFPGLQQMGENKTNRRQYGNRPVVPARLERLPKEEQRYSDTPLTFSLLAKAPQLLGLDPVAPLEAQNVARGIFSQATPYITTLTDPLARFALGENAPATTARPLDVRPVNPLSAFRASPRSGTVSERQYYAIRDRVQRGQRAIDLSYKTGDLGPGLRAVQRTPAAAQLDVELLFEEADKILGDLRDKRSVIYAKRDEGTFDPEAVRSALDGLREQEHTIYRNAVKILRRMGVRP